MPSYIYECPLGHQLAVNHSIHETPDYYCDRVFNNPANESGAKVNGLKCGEKMKRIISASSFILKGSGWARDGYAGKK